VNKCPCKLDGQHHEFQHRRYALGRWLNGSSRLQKLLGGAWGEDVDLNMPHQFGAFIRQLSLVILWLLRVSQFLQYLPEHLGNLSSIASVVLELANILIWKLSPWQTCFSMLHLWCNRGMHYRTCRQKVTMSAMGNNPYVRLLEED
jgi:hypothetical protein